MDSSDASQIIILLILLLLSAFFSSAETCLTTVNKVRMQSMAENNTKNAATVLKLIEKPTQLLSGILIGNNIVNLTASSLTTSYAIRISQRNGLPISASLLTGAATAILTILVLIFGEIVPKSLATINAEKLALICEACLCTDTDSSPCFLSDEPDFFWLTEAFTCRCVAATGDHRE